MWSRSEVPKVAVSVSKTWKAFPALVACLFAVAAVGCLVHTDAFDEAQAPHQGHHHPSSSSSAHLTLDLHCRVAILPAVSALLAICLGTLYLCVLLFHAVVPSFPPFIPPKALAYA